MLGKTSRFYISHVTLIITITYNAFKSNYPYIWAHLPNSTIYKKIIAFYIIFKTNVL